MDREGQTSPFFKQRKLRVDILTIFLTLFAVSFVFVITFTYFKNSKSILEFSKGEVARVSEVIVERISSLSQQVELIPEFSSGLVESLGEGSLENPALVAYMLDVIKYYPKIYAFYIGRPSGQYIEVSNLSLVNQTRFLSDPSKTLPEGAIFSLRYIDRSKSPPVEKWEYKNDKLATLTSENVMNSQFDPRMRPWYLGARYANGLYWTDIYPFSTTGLPGITISYPLYKKAGELNGVIGVDLTLGYLEQFLAEQKIGKTGKAFIMNRTGEVIIPLAMKDDQKEISAETITLAFAEFSKGDAHDFIIKSKGVEYLVNFHPFPVTAGKEWLITIIVPLNDFFGDLFKAQTQVSLISLFILIFSGIVVVYTSKTISDPIVTLAKEVDKIRQLDLESKVRVLSNIREIRTMDSSIASMRSALRSFGRYVPKEIVKQLLLKDNEIMLGGDKKEITIFFSDIAGFTTIAESISSDLLMQLLTDYFGLLSEIILTNQGTIDKYIGDSIMAFWNAPLNIEDHARIACHTALQCQQHLAKFNQKLKEEGKAPLITRIGINSGKAFVGNIGTTERINYTVIGDVVNTAQRLEQLGKQYHVAIVISEQVVEKIGDSFLIRPLDYLAVKGRKEKIAIYELMEEKKKASPEQLELSHLFTEAYTTFFQGDQGKAKSQFLLLKQKFPEDYPTQIYLDRIQG